MSWCGARGRRSDEMIGGARLPNGLVILTKPVGSNVNNACRADSLAEPMGQRNLCKQGGLGVWITANGLHTMGQRLGSLIGRIESGTHRTVFGSGSNA